MESFLFAMLLPVLVTPAPVPIPRADNMVDLTHSLVGDGKMPKWPGDTVKKYEFTIENRGEYHDTGIYMEVNSISLSEHTATHMDAPAHFGKPGISKHHRIHQIPQRDLIAEGIVVDISEKAKKDPDAEVTVDDLKAWEKKYGRIPARSFVFMYSGWQQYWTNKTAFLGTKHEDPANLHFPGFSGNATRWLGDKRQILAIGVDTISLDPGNSTALEAHRYLLTENNRFGFEMVANVERLPPRGFTVYAFPMKIYDGSGAPTRMFAFWNNSVCDFKPSIALLVFLVISMFSIA